MDDAVAALVQALSTAPRDRLFVLPGVGWLGVHHYPGHEGRNPRTGEPVSVPARRLPFFTADPELVLALAQLPPSGALFADDRTRYVRAIRPDATREELDDEPATVARTPGVQALADTIRRRLAAGEVAEVPALGTFEAVPARQIVRFTTADELRARLVPTT